MRGKKVHYRMFFLGIKLVKFKNKRPLLNIGQLWVEKLLIRWLWIEKN